MNLVKRMKAAYDICSGSAAFLNEEKDRIHFYIAIRSIVFKLTKGEAPDTAQMNAKVSGMIQEAIQSEGVEEIFKLGEEGQKEVFLMKITSPRSIRSNFPIPKSNYSISFWPKQLMISSESTR